MAMRMSAMRRNTKVKSLIRRSTVVVEEALEELEGVVFTISGIFKVSQNLVSENNLGAVFELFIT